MKAIANVASMMTFVNDKNAYFLIKEEFVKQSLVNFFGQIEATGIKFFSQKPKKISQREQIDTSTLQLVSKIQ